MPELLTDPEAKAAKYEMAEKYERLATRAREWVNRADVPKFIKSAPPTVLSHAFPKIKPLLELFRSQLAAKGKLCLQPLVGQLGLECFHLIGRVLNGCLVNRWLLEQRPQLLAGFDQTLNICLGCCSLGLKQPLDISRLLIR